MIQKCPKCGKWNKAPYEPSKTLVGKFLDKTFYGIQKSALFECSCGNVWLEKDANKDQSLQYEKECKSSSNEPDIKYTSNDLKPLLSDETKKTLVHILMHVLGK